MTLYRTAYDTLVGSALLTTQVEKAIKEAIIHDHIDQVSLNLITSTPFKPVFVTGVYDSESNIPLFSHPMTVGGPGREQYLVIDVRPYLKSNRQRFTDINIHDVSNLVSNRSGFDFVVDRSILQLLWLSGRENDIKTHLEFAGTVFTHWVSEAIGKTYLLDPKSQLELSLITHYYFQSLFYHEDRFYEDALQLMAIQAKKALNVQANLIFSVFEKIKQMGSLKDYCEAVKEIIQDIRLESFNEGVLMTIIGQSWFGYGFNAKELLAVALEHPPTWATVVYFALTDKSYKNTQIAKLADRFGRGQISSHYIKAFEGLINGCKEEQPDLLQLSAFD